MAEEMKNAPETKVRYSDEELQEFKAIIIEMLEKAKKEYKTLRDIVTQATILRIHPLPSRLWKRVP